MRFRQDLRGNLRFSKDASLNSGFGSHRQFDVLTSPKNLTIQVLCRVQVSKQKHMGLGDKTRSEKDISPRVQVPNNHILSKILTYITTILKPTT